MTQRTTKTVTISLPPNMVDELDRVRRSEHRTRSELLREALRHYMASSTKRIAVPVEVAHTDEMRALKVAELEYTQGKTVSLEDLQNELGYSGR